MLSDRGALHGGPESPLRRPDAVIRTLLIGGAVLFGLWTLSPVVVISAGERGVKTTFGKPDEQVYEARHPLQDPAGPGHAHDGRAPAKG